MLLGALVGLYLLPCAFCLACMGLFLRKAPGECWRRAAKRSLLAFGFVYFFCAPVAVAAVLVFGQRAPMLAGEEDVLVELGLAWVCGALFVLLSGPTRLAVVVGCGLRSFFKTPAGVAECVEKTLQKASGKGGHQLLFVVIILVAGVGLIAIWVFRVAAVSEAASVLP
ncbi:MAG: hypothetical protein R6V05_00015 [Candidatus Brocadiia bacterium]